MRTGVGAIYDPTIVTAISSIALRPVVRKDHFSRQHRGSDSRKKEAVFKILENETKNENYDFLLYEEKRTIDFAV